MKIKDMKRLLERQMELWERLEAELNEANFPGGDIADTKAFDIASLAITELEKAVGPKAPRVSASKKSRYPNVYWNEAKQAWVGRIWVHRKLHSYGGSKDEDQTWQTFLARLEREGHGALVGELVRKAGLGDREIGR